MAQAIRSTIRLGREMYYLEIIQQYGNLNSTAAAMRTAIRIMYQLEQLHEAARAQRGVCLLSVTQSGTPVKETPSAAPPNVAKRLLNVYLDQVTAEMVTALATHYGKDLSYTIRHCLTMVGRQFELMLAVRNAGGQPKLYIDQVEWNGTVSRQTEVHIS